VQLFFEQIVSFFLSTFFLVLVVLWALLVHLYQQLRRLLRPTPSKVFDWDKPEYAKEKVVREVQPYATAVGFEIIDEQVETADGFYLR